MIFLETPLAGAFVIDLDLIEDSRGFFARAFCQHELMEHGLNPVVAQENIVFSKWKGTLRGMHFQYPPAVETKLVRATRGALLDVIVDLRPESSTYLQHFAIELSAEDRRALYVPERFAHGFQTLEDRTEMRYQAGEFYSPEHESGLLHSDPRLQLTWPLPVSEISTKDASWKRLRDIEPSLRRRMAVSSVANPCLTDSRDGLVAIEEKRR